MLRKPNTDNKGKLFVMLFADFEPLPRSVLRSAPGYAPVAVYNIVYPDKFLATYKLCTAMLRQCPFIKIVYPDKFPATYKPCTPIAHKRNKLCTRTAKSTPYLSCHRDNFPAKVPGLVAGWLCQVTQPPFIAGPLGLREALQLSKF